jgi:RNA polymerase sigma-70 factor (ECF subfamily)
MAATQQTDGSGNFVQRLTEAQFALQAYITFLVGNPEDAKDVLQDVNLTLWKEAAGYDPKRPFLAWAKAVAFYQVKTFRTQQSRDRLVFDEALLEKMAAEADEDEEDMRQTLEALEHCVEGLTAGQKALLRQRYVQGLGVNVIAGALRRSADAVSMLLYRIRDKLGRCVERALAKEGRHA